MAKSFSRIENFNAKVELESIFGPTVRQISLYDNTSFDCMRLRNFAKEHGSLNIQKAIWLSPDRFTANQIDHNVIKGRHFSNGLDVYMFRGPNIDSGHWLVKCNLRTPAENFSSFRMPTLKKSMVQWRTVAKQLQRIQCVHNDAAVCSNANHCRKL